MKKQETLNNMKNEITHEQRDLMIDFLVKDAIKVHLKEEFEKDIISNEELKKILDMLLKAWKHWSNNKGEIVRLTGGNPRGQLGRLIKSKMRVRKEVFFSEFSDEIMIWFDESISLLSKNLSPAHLSIIRYEVFEKKDRMIKWCRDNGYTVSTNSTAYYDCLRESKNMLLNDIKIFGINRIS